MLYRVRILSLGERIFLLITRFHPNEMNLQQFCSKNNEPIYFKGASLLAGYRILISKFVEKFF